MSDETIKTSAIRNYLLGDLPESGAEEIERWYFADGQRVDEIWAVFGEIAEECLSGGLSEGELRRVGKRGRAAPALARKFENEKTTYKQTARKGAGKPGRTVNVESS